MIDPIAWLILIPLLWATLAFVLGPGRGAVLGNTGIAAQLLLALALAGQLAGDAQEQAIGGWEAPLGIALRADGLSVVMLLLTQGVALLVALYAAAYFSRHAAGNSYFWPLSGCLMAAMNALYLSSDVFNLYVTLELLSLAAIGMVASEGNAGSVAAALRYLFASLIGSGAYLLGVAVLYGAYGTVSIVYLADLIQAGAPEAISWAAGLMLAGLMLKTALFPLHYWLPPAHGGAPTPVSALLSALVIKASFYLAVRLWLDLFGQIATSYAAQWIGVLGTGAIIWGTYQALRQRRLKMLIAYSTVAQIGYLFLMFPLVTDATPTGSQYALHGAVMQAVAHGFAKAAMFGAAGVIILALGHDNIAQLGGLAQSLPLTVFTFALAGVTLMGLPPSGGFIAKWILIDSAIVSGQWWWVVVLVAGGLFTATYLFKVLRHTFSHSEENGNAAPNASIRPLPRLLEWSAFLLALGSLLIGLMAGSVLTLLELS
jgi:multicomponent Na+:H+ antiporter subunit D